MSCDHEATAACYPASAAGTAFESLHRAPNKKPSGNIKIVFIIKYRQHSCASEMKTET